MANFQVSSTTVSKAQTVSTFENGIWLEDKYSNVDRCFYGEMGCTAEQFASATPQQRAAYIQTAYTGATLHYAVNNPN
jgi:hypothetical protein